MVIGLKNHHFDPEEEIEIMLILRLLVTFPSPPSISSYYCAREGIVLVLVLVLVYSMS